MMAYRKNGVITRMDRIAMGVAGPHAEVVVNPRLSILVNLIFMAAGITGLVLTARGEIGPTLVFFAMIMASTHAGIVEYQKRGEAPLDEREWSVFWKAMAIGAFMSFASFVFFIGVVFYTLLWGRRVTENNYWNEYADTLEWTLPSPPPEHTFEQLPKQSDWDKSHAH